MRSAGPILIALALAAASLALIPPASAQAGNSDLTIVALTAQNPVYEGKEPVTVIATVKNLGPDETTTPSDNQVHFRYNTTSRCLTGDGAVESCDQPFNNTDPIPPNATVNVTVEWSPTEDQIGPGLLIATVDSSSEPDGASGNNRMTTPIHIAEHNGTLDLTDTEERTAFPGQATPYRSTLTNVGNVETTFELNISNPPDEAGEPQHLPEGWNATPHPANVTLAPGESETIVSLIQPPANAEANDDVNATLWATAKVPARHNETISLPETTVITELPDDFAKDVTIEPLEASSFAGPDPGDQTVAYRVTNNGSRPDAYTFEAAVAGDIDENVNATPPGIVALNASQATIVNATVTVDETVPVGQRGTLELGVLSVNAAEGAAPTTAVHQLVGSGPNLNITSIAPPDPAYAAEGNVTVDVTIANTANLLSPPGNLTLTAERAGFAAATVITGMPPIAPGTNVTVPVALPVTELTGSYVLAVEANQPATFNETVETDNDAKANLQVRTTGLEVLPAQTLDVEPGGFARLVRPPHLFEVRNTGNTAEIVRVTVESEHGWLEPTTQQTTVAPGTRQGVPVEVRVPELPGVPADEIRVNAELVNRTAIASENTTQLTVLDEDPPELLSVNLTQAQEATVPFPVTARFQDAVGVAEAWIELEHPNGGTERVEMTPGDGDRFEASLTVDTIGQAHLTLHAVDRSPDNNTYNDPDPRPVELTYDRHPRIGHPAQENATLRSGEPIPLEVDDRAGLASINVSVSGDAVDLRGDQTIDTTDWREGTYAVHVEATNRFGLSNATTFNVTIDNTPPRIQDVTVEPSDPAPGEQVTIEAAVDGDPINVTARIQGSGEAPTSLTLEQRGEVYAGTVTLPEGAFEIAVLARDAAGNTGSLDQPLDLSVEAGMPVPWIAVPLALAAAAITARSHRRDDA